MDRRNHPLARRGALPSAERVADDLVGGLHRLLRVLVLTERVSVGKVARRLAMHPRTLNRRLREQHTSFHALVEQVRAEIALQLVENSRLSLAQIAAALCYADSSSFTRAFRRWTGATPSAWRSRPRAAPPQALGSVGGGRPARRRPHPKTAERTEPSVPAGSPGGASQRQRM